MTAEQKERARKRAARAGRRYPNLVDNMAIIAADKRSPRRTTTTRRIARKQRTTARTKRARKTH
jgi:hypothetical protein